MSVIISHVAEFLARDAGGQFREAVWTLGEQIAQRARVFSRGQYIEPLVRFFKMRAKRFR